MFPIHDIEQLISAVCKVDWKTNKYIHRLLTEALVGMEDLIIVCDCTNNAFISRWPTLFSTEYIIYPDASVNDHEAGTKTLLNNYISRQFPFTLNISDTMLVDIQPVIEEKCLIKPDLLYEYVLVYIESKY